MMPRPHLLLDLSTVAKPAVVVLSVVQQVWAVLASKAPGMAVEIMLSNSSGGPRPNAKKGLAPGSPKFQRETQHLFPGLDPLQDRLPKPHR